MWSHWNFREFHFPQNEGNEGEDADDERRQNLGARPGV